MLLPSNILNFKAGKTDITIKRKKRPTDNVVVHTENGNDSEAIRNIQQVFSLHTTNRILGNVSKGSIHKRNKTIRYRVRNLTK